MKHQLRKNYIGKIGEEIAEKFLRKHGFSITHRNYLKKFGEIDIVAEKGGILHFFEVKSVSREILVPRSPADSYRPEDNVHKNKLKRIGRAIQIYLDEFHVKQEWKFHVITVTINDSEKTAFVRMLKDIVI